MQKDQREMEVDYPNFEGDGDLNAKKELLRKEIKEFYNQDQKILEQFVASFEKFIKKRVNFDSKIDGDLNLDLITLSQLKELVTTFRLQIAQGNVNKQQLENKHPSQILKSLILQEFQQTQPQKSFYGNGAWDYILRIQNINCMKEKDFFNNQEKKVKITIKSNHIERQSFFFGLSTKTSLILELTTQYLDKQITVFRSLEDFLFLQNVLCQIFPHSFIPPLSITDKELKNIENQSIKEKVIKKCQHFLLNEILSNHNLLQNVYTFRFLVEQKKTNYEQHKKNNSNKEVNNINQLKTFSGKISVDVSKISQINKQSLNSTSKLLKNSWKNIQNLTLEIQQKIRSVDSSIFKLYQELNIINRAITNQSELTTFKFQPYSRTIANYTKIIDLTATSLKTYQQYFQNLKQQFIDRTAQKWNYFDLYKQKLIKKSEAYQQRRKIYLDKQGQKFKKQLNRQEVNLSTLDLHKDQEEWSWVENQTIWYGYLNSQIIRTYQEFIFDDEQHLKRYANPNLIQNVQISKEHILSLIEDGI